MDYNNNNRNFRREGQGRPQQHQNSRPLPAVIKPEEVPENYIDQADSIMREMAEQRQNITTSKIRNLLSLVSGVYDAERLRTASELTEESIAKIGMMRIRTAYEAGRDNATKVFVEKARLLQYLKGIGSDREDLIRFAHYMEALVAYHRYYGGREA